MNQQNILVNLFYARSWQDKTINKLFTVSIRIKNYYKESAPSTLLKFSFGPILKLKFFALILNKFPFLKIMIPAINIFLVYLFLCQCASSKMGNNHNITQAKFDD